jgi:phosphocarrier protein HPr
VQKIDIVLTNEYGLHARPASNFVKEASQFKSSIKILKDGEEYEAKSIFSVLLLGVKKGDTVTIVVRGSDEKEAVEALKNLSARNFGEYTGINGFPKEEEQFEAYK